MNRRGTGWAFVVAGALVGGIAIAAPPNDKAIHKWGELRGVVSSCDGDGSATVYVPGTSIFGRTGPSGDFVFPFVPPGAYELLVERSGQAPWVVSDVQVRDGRVTHLGALFFCPDEDGDGYGIDVDCDDSDPAVHPGASEVCGGGDENCDGRVDEGCPSCTDADQDGYFAEADCGTAMDCDDANPNVHPGASEVCDGRDNDCDALVDEDGVCETLDLDADGFSVADGDCDDEDPRVHPNALDDCDRDNNCDGRIDFACDDSNACTIDTCHEGRCRFVPEPGMLCGEDAVCTTSGHCAPMP